jgi:hypothetical protein
MGVYQEATRYPEEAEPFKRVEKIVRVLSKPVRCTGHCADVSPVSPGIPTDGRLAVDQAIGHP